MSALLVRFADVICAFPHLRRLIITIDKYFREFRCDAFPTPLCIKFTISERILGRVKCNDTAICTAIALCFSVTLSKSRYIRSKSFFASSNPVQNCSDLPWQNFKAQPWLHMATYGVPSLYSSSTERHTSSSVSKRFSRTVTIERVATKSCRQAAFVLRQCEHRLSTAENKVDRQTGDFGQSYWVVKIPASIQSFVNLTTNCPCKEKAWPIFRLSHDFRRTFGGNENRILVDRLPYLCVCASTHGNENSPAVKTRVSHFFYRACCRVCACVSASMCEIWPAA